MSEQFALRVLAATYQMASELAVAEDDEQDPARLARLYRLDHAVTRVRRQAENLQVLTGRVIEDAGRQVTALLDVIRAALSAIEYYPRVHIGRIADLAVVDFAADDLIRILTELLDNATRFAPPTATATVSAHLTEQGSVLIRVEDTGVGLPPSGLPVINALLTGAIPAVPTDEAAHRLGLFVVARLASAHRMPVRLVARPGGGTTATILVPTPLLCETPRPPVLEPSPTDQQSTTTGPARSAPPTTRLALVGASAPTTARGLPRRVGTSMRRPAEGVADNHPTGRSDRPVSGPASGRTDPERPPDNRPPDRTPWYDDVAGFDAGFGDGAVRQDQGGNP